MKRGLNAKKQTEQQEPTRKLTGRSLPKCLELAPPAPASEEDHSQFSVGVYFSQDSVVWAHTVWGIEFGFFRVRFLLGGAPLRRPEVALDRVCN